MLNLVVLSCRVGDCVHVSVVVSSIGETVTDGSGGVGDGGGVGIIAGAAQVSVSTPVDESESGGAGDAHCGNDDVAVLSALFRMLSWYLAHSALAAAARCLSVSGLGLVFFSFCWLPLACTSWSEKHLMGISVSVSSCLRFRRCLGHLSCCLCGEHLQQLRAYFAAFAAEFDLNVRVACD